MLFALLQIWSGDDGESCAAVLPGQVDASKCFCVGKGLGHATAGQPAGFSIHTLDCYGNTRTQGADSFVVAAQLQNSSTAPIQGKVEEVGSGIYHATYGITTAGSCEVSITLLDGKTVCNFSMHSPAAYAHLTCDCLLGCMFACHQV